MFGSAPSTSSGTVQALKGLMDRLSSPDLTAAEALDLQPRLLDLLEAIEGGKADRTNPAGGCLAARGSDRCVVV